MGVGEDDKVAEKVSKGGKLNRGQVGFYRVNYARETWKELAGRMGFGMMSNTDRLGLVSDVFAMAKGGYQPVSVALNFVRGMGKIDVEDEFVVWQQVCERLVELSGVYKGEEFEEVRREGGKEEWSGVERSEAKRSNDTNVSCAANPICPSQDYKTFVKGVVGKQWEMIGWEKVRSENGCCPQLHADYLDASILLTIST